MNTHIYIYRYTFFFTFYHVRPYNRDHDVTSANPKSDVAGRSCDCGASLWKMFVSHQHIPSGEVLSDVNPCFVMSHLISHLSDTSGDAKGKIAKP